MLPYSPEDQAILEQEYRKDSKPDKAARLRIVKLVALGEKEVQIWFQNRRQTHRRKSQPLSSSMEHCSPDQENHVVAYTQHDGKANTEQHGCSHTDLQPSQQDEEAPGGGSQMMLSSDPAALTATRQHGQAVDNRAPNSQSFIVPTEHDTQEQNITSRHARSLKRTSSGVRLSLTSQGSAKVLQEDESSPTPPSSPPNPNATFDEQRTSVSSRQRVQRASRLPSGRSRDSRAWEFWCDDSARNDLKRQADHESTGSAADAINIMRSNSRKVLAPTTERQSFMGNDNGAKRPRRQNCDNFGEAAKLARSASAPNKTDRHPPSSFTLFEDDSRGPLEKHRADRHILPSAAGDSDKENLDPTAMNASDLKSKPQKPTGQRKRLLSKSNSHVARSRPFTDTRRYRPTLTSKDTRQSQAGELLNPEEDAELAVFMRGSRTSKDSALKATSSGEDDLDCINSLLSLSQGNWK
ncbi:MAG: hypothetical protein M1828_007510 [Chrysothrix sp. TS-e1954]|nr:MAG: hypothetical protein M1828_007510 [Chrysothrix sp. TS-e1954]